uniref:Uncharacterized protein n=1 Tax=uncultured prokaryote TaxID=198431 RepID=A0A0H5Q1R9_9ZZZZ|nr:hypothetical protein [uncultured prokaryote]
MSFVSQVSKSRASSSRIGDSEIVITQSYKPSADSQELSIRATTATLKKAGINIGDTVDILYDIDNDKWMIKKTDGALKITGKENAPTGLIRYTLKEGHARFTEDKAILPVRKYSIDDFLDITDEQIIFKVK